MQIGLSLFMMAIGHLSFVANQTGDSLQIELFCLTVVLYLAVVFALVGAMLRRFLIH